jgi:AmmeMemoRadiSam system protein A
MTAALSPAEGRALLALARAAIDERLGRGGRLLQVKKELALTEGLQVRRGCFVTLKTPEADGLTLRGCVGSVLPRAALCDAVIDAAVHAAFHDPRFSPLEPDELASVVLSVSVLGIPEPVPSATSIVAGRHGVVLRARGKDAVFLPEVAVDHGWTVTQLLENLASKAGLPSEAWKEAMLEVFTSEHFVETARSAC